MMAMMVKFSIALPSDGEEGNDTINGADGNEFLYGEGDNDVISGGKGNDFLGGGSGTNTLTGGVGIDKFLFDVDDDPLSGNQSVTTLTDFNASVDFLRFEDVVDTNNNGVDINDLLAVTTVDNTGVDLKITVQHGSDTLEIHVANQDIDLNALWSNGHLEVT